jgi:hypothetical protein
MVAVLGPFEALPCYIHTYIHTYGGNLNSGVQKVGEKRKPF